MTSFTPDFPDFATPVAVLDQSTEFTNGSINSYNNTLGPFDVSRLNTIYLRIQPPSVITPAGHRYVTSVVWREQGNPVYQEGITFHSAASYFDNLSELYWTLPVRGQTFEISTTGDTASTVLTDVLGSTRAAPPKPRLVSNRTPFSRFAQAVNLGSLAAGVTSAKFYVPPFGEGFLPMINMRGLPARILVSAVAFEAGVMTTHTALDTTPADPMFGGQYVFMPNVATEWTVTNNDTVAHTPVVNILDVS